MQGPQKTLNALKANSKHEIPKGDDPWEHQTDPWADWKGPSKVAKVTNPGSSRVEVDVIAAQLEKRIMTQVDQKLDGLGPHGSEDADMTGADDRVTVLEARLSKLEVDVATQHKQQTQQNVEIKGHVNQLQQQMVAQGHSIQQHFDNKLQEQLSQIESLLKTKQSRTE